jgi:hypothetical protein
MSSNTGLRVLAGAVALAISGTVLANTTLDGTSTGDVFLNIVDATNNTSFLFDTGVSQATFNGGSSYSYSLASDPNYTAFVAAEGGTDTLDYSVFSATKGGSSGPFTVYFTSSIPVTYSANTTNISGAQNNIANFAVGASSVTSSTTNSALLTPKSRIWFLDLADRLVVRSYARSSTAEGLLSRNRIGSHARVVKFSIGDSGSFAEPGHSERPDAKCWDTHTRNSTRRETIEWIITPIGVVVASRERSVRRSIIAARETISKKK